ncbi:ATP-dependent DNA helicase [Acidiplasma aeolicum]|uniref:DNA 3'-5' helicase n=1 Tax=Acidiplasma aeolicum TaxID=507754 RepID=A0A0Q0WKH9_9ARCH|nr:ATP-dependent DNA helicase [Acidiplasma aeolicum]KQB36245.1 hypothetical protein AOG54_02270 [Acidiplasma aeolicum]
MNTLVIANPGTGKTTNISMEVAKLLKNGISAKDILCITFTNKAVEQLRSKINEFISKFNIPGNAYDIKVMTFHGYAYEQLSESLNHRDIISYNVVRYLIFKKLNEIRAFNYSREYIIDTLIPKIENALRYIKSFGILPEDIIKNHDDIIINVKNLYKQKRIRNISMEEELYLFEYFIEAFKYYEENKNNYDFNDLLMQCLKLQYRDNYKYIFVDELQDVNELEAQLALSAGENKYFVGDKKQSIFGFQGGALSVFESLIKDPNFTKKSLDTNYRSTENILKYAKAYYIKNASDSSEELNNFHGIMEQGNIVTIIESENPEATVAMALKGLKGKTGVLARTNDQISLISEYLDRNGIEYSSDTTTHTVIEAKNDIINFLRGIFYDDPENITRSLFSVFSGMTLKEAFETSENIKNANYTLDIFSDDNPVLGLKKMGFNRETIKKIFEERIIPIAASINREYFITARTVKAAIDEFFSMNSDYTRSDFFNFLDLIYSEEFMEAGEKDIVLTTVHKAKGREFDNVIYIPKKTRKSEAFIDVISSAIIKSIKNIDVEKELDEESIRINFVAITRAKYNLTIISTPGEMPNFSIPEYSTVLSGNTDGLNNNSFNKYNEAYFQFVAGNYDRSRDILSENTSWLVSEIYNFFKSKNVLSFSLISSIDNPFQFLKRYILRLDEKTTALLIGLQSHELAELNYKNEIEEENLEEDQASTLERIRSINNEIERNFNARQIESETGIIIKVNEMFDEFKGIDDSIMFYGKLDAVFAGDGNIIILDYKTDKNTGNANHHRVQLLSYKILYSVKNSVPVEKIFTALGYIRLRGNINTNKIEHGIVYKEPDKNSEEKLKNYITKFLEYKNNPEKFIQDLLNANDNSVLYKRIKNMLINFSKM